MIPHPSKKFLTASGRLLDVTNLSPKDIHIGDIAHHLTGINRYTGALPLGAKWSVAHHSIIIAEYLQSIGFNKQTCLAGLLHDASEAYLGDIRHDIKPLLPQYKELEAQVTKLINDKYIPLNKQCKIDFEEIESSDKRIVLNEAYLFFNKYHSLFCEEHFDRSPLQGNIKGDSINNRMERIATYCDDGQIHYHFLSLFEEFGGKIDYF